MKTAKEREDAFRNELKELLAKHGAELTVTDDGKAYGMQIGVCEIYMSSQWDAEGNLLADTTHFCL
jgi:hypothetical protein